MNHSSMLSLSVVIVLHMLVLLMIPTLCVGEILNSRSLASLQVHALGAGVVSRPAITLADDAFNITFTDQTQAQKVFEVNTGKLTTGGSCACMQTDHVKFNHDLGGAGKERFSNSQPWMCDEICCEYIFFFYSISHALYLARRQICNLHLTLSLAHPYIYLQIKCIHSLVSAYIWCKLFLFVPY